jgi:ubiquinone/menaquinone biosynthesis C-methylase UbiE
VKLNALGRASMNNAVRAGLQRHLMARWFERLGGRVPGGRGLEVGCGRGAALRMLRERFGLREMVGLDLDPRMLVPARRGAHGAALVLADVAGLPFLDASFDAVFDFGAIHFVSDWERALDEVRRVLRPGGRYYFEWVTGGFLRAFYPFATRGFERMRVPEPEALLGALERRGLPVGGRLVRPRLAAAATWLVGDVIGVGRVTA